MKYILIFLTSLFLQTANAQKGGIQISAQSKTITADLQNEDTQKVLVVNSKLKSVATGKLSVVNKQWAEEKAWKRSFTVYNDNDNPVAGLSPCKTSGKYEVPLKKLISNMEAGQTYSLYTIAIPRDPKKAALVRVRRVFVCRISII